jgi:hypothetical protein
MPRASAAAPRLKSSDPFSLAQIFLPEATALAVLGHVACVLR